jgi:hypothetical protein
MPFVLALAIGILLRTGLLSAVQPMHKARQHAGGRTCLNESKSANWPYDKL